MNTPLHLAARTRAALDLASSRALQRGDLALGAELANARCEAWFAARALGVEANALEYLATRLVRVGQALTRQRASDAMTRTLLTVGRTLLVRRTVASVPASNDAHGALATA